MISNSYKHYAIYIFILVTLFLIINLVIILFGCAFHLFGKNNWELGRLVDSETRFGCHSEDG